MRQFNQGKQWIRPNGSVANEATPRFAGNYAIGYEWERVGKPIRTYALLTVSFPQRHWATSGWKVGKSLTRFASIQWMKSHCACVSPTQTMFAPLAARVPSNFATILIILMDDGELSTFTESATSRRTRQPGIRTSRGCSGKSFSTVDDLAFTFEIWQTVSLRCGNFSPVRCTWGRVYQSGIKLKYVGKWRGLGEREDSPAHICAKP